MFINRYVCMRKCAGGFTQTFKSKFNTIVDFFWRMCFENANVRLHFVLLGQGTESVPQRRRQARAGPSLCWMTTVGASAVASSAFVGGREDTRILRVQLIGEILGGGAAKGLHFLRSVDQGHSSHTGGGSTQTKHRV